MFTEVSNTLSVSKVTVMKWLLFFVIYTTTVLSSVLTIVIKMIWFSSLCQSLLWDGILWDKPMGYCGTFPKMGIVLVFVWYLITSCPRCFRFLMFMLSGAVELLFMLFEMAYCTYVVVDSMSSIIRFLLYNLQSYVSVDFVSALKIVYQHISTRTTKPVN